MAVYGVTFQVSANASLDMVRVTPESGGLMTLLECHITDEGDLGDEQLTVGIYKASSDGGAGTARSFVPYDRGDDAFGGSAQFVLSAIATKAMTIDRQAFNSQAGYHYTPLKGSRPVFSGSERCVVRLENSPSATALFALTMVVETDGV